MGWNTAHEEVELLLTYLGVRRGFVAPSLANDCPGALVYHLPDHERHQGTFPVRKQTKSRIDVTGNSDSPLQGGGEGGVSTEVQKHSVRPLFNAIEGLL